MGPATLVCQLAESNGQANIDGQEVRPKASVKPTNFYTVADELLGWGK